MRKTILFADVLGFGNLAMAPGAGGATDALSDLAHLLSDNDELATFLRRPVWTKRYGLSDSLFLVSEDPVSACAAAAEFFFNLAYVNHQATEPILLRGGMAIGEALFVKPLFPESATANLVGEAVVRAVALEKQKPKGPRLLVEHEVAAVWEESNEPKAWLLNRTEGAQADLLWLLPPDPAYANGLLIGEVCRTALRLIKLYGGHPSFGHHYLGYLDLLLRSLERLAERRPEEAATALRVCGLKTDLAELEPLLSSETMLLDLLKRLADEGSLTLS